MVAHMTKIEPTGYYILLMKNTTTTCEILLFKKSDSNQTNFQEIQSTEEHVKLYKWHNEPNLDCGKLQDR